MFYAKINHIRRFMSLNKFDTSKNYYKSLNISKGASKTDIKKAFRELAKKYHPDNNKGNEQKFKQINEAYQVLSSENNRKDYDISRGQTQSHSSPHNNYHRAENRYSKKGGFYYDNQQHLRSRYRKPQGWADPYQREKIIRQQFRKQQQESPYRQDYRYEQYKIRQRQNQNFFREQEQFYQQQQYNYSRRGSNYSDMYGNFYDHKASQNMNIDRQKVRRAEQQFRKMRQSYWQQQNKEKMNNFSSEIDKKIQELTKGINNGIQGLVKINNYLGDKIRQLTDKNKVTDSIKSIWDKFKKK